MNLNHLRQIFISRAKFNFSNACKNRKDFGTCLDDSPTGADKQLEKQLIFLFEMAYFTETAVSTQMKAFPGQQLASLLNA